MVYLAKYPLVYTNFAIDILFDKKNHAKSSKEIDFSSSTKISFVDIPLSLNFEPLFLYFSHFEVKK